MSETDNTNRFIDGLNETIIAFKAFTEGNVTHDYLHALGTLFYGEEDNQAERDLKFQDDCDHSETEIFLALVDLHIVLDDAFQLLDGFKRLYPDQLSSVQRTLNLIGQALCDNDDLLDRLKAQHDEFLVDNDLPCGQSMVEHAWDDLTECVTRTYQLDVADKNKNIHVLREQSFKVAEAYQKVADLHGATAQKKLGYFYQCLLHDTDPDLPITNVEWNSLTGEQKHAVMTQFTEHNITAARNTVNESNKIMSAVIQMTAACFPKNKHQLGVRMPA